MRISDWSSDVCSSDLIEIDVAAELAVGQAVDADVDDGRAGPDPVALHHARFADGGDNDVGACDFAGDIGGEAVAAGRGRTGQHQLQHHRPAEVIAGTDDHGALALDGFAGDLDRKSVV